MIEIIFGHSSSKSYPRAVAIAQTIASYSFRDGEHHLQWDLKDSDILAKLYWIIEPWKSTRVIVDGVETRRPKILTSWMLCYEDVKQNGSCFKLNNYDVGPKFPFGCRGPRELQFWKYSPWLRIGKLSGRRWIFDKPAIAKFVHERLIDYRICPRRRPEWIDAFMDVFPAVIDPATDLLWEYQTRDGLAVAAAIHVVMGAPYDDAPSDIKEVVGVGPRDPLAGKEILDQLFAIVNLKHNMNGG